MMRSQAITSIPVSLKCHNEHGKSSATTTRRKNHHTINSFKRSNSTTTMRIRTTMIRPTKLQAVPRCDDNNNCVRGANEINSNKPKLLGIINNNIIITNEYNNRSMLKLISSLLLLLVVTCLQPQATDCDVVCPRDISSIYPCSCNNGTQGLLIKCSDVNLPLLANSMKNLNNYNSMNGQQVIPVEQVEVENSSIGKLFGPLFSDSSLYRFHSTIRELDIRNSGVKFIDSSSFSRQLMNNIQYLMFDRNHMQQVPIDLINNMTQLKTLNLSMNWISNIENDSFIKLINLTELDLSGNRISRLNKNSFNSLYMLEYLNLNSNEINKLEKNLFNFGRKLKHLDISNNKLTTLDRQDFNELTNLETLKVGNNLLTTIPRSIFSRNGKLYNLDLSHNKLDDIDTYLFKSVRFLKDLNMAGNLIKEITKNTFSSTTRIKKIDMSSNYITALNQETFKNLEWLEHIDLSYNQIVNISNDAFNHIFSVNIDLSHNRLTRIFYYAFHEVTNITKLDLSHNLIDDEISPIAFESCDCAYLDLSYNLIQDISKIPISNFTGLRVLDLSHNQITELNKKSFSQKSPLYELHTVDLTYNNISQISGNVLEKLKSLRTLNISHNSLRRLTSGSLGGSPTLLDLDLSNNNLVEVVTGTLIGLVSMRNLDLRYNRLKKMIPIPVALNSIHLEHNEISQLSRSAFPTMNSLLELYLDHNRITSIEENTFSSLLALHTLSLSYNNMSSVPAVALKDLSSLQSLRLDSNNIQRLPRKSFGVLPIVFHLHLQNNNISQISDRAFEGMLQLLTLNLSHNNIVELPPETFGGLVSLRTLDLSNNMLNSFENKTRSAMEDLLSLEVANFSSNKLSNISPRTFLSSPYIPYKLTHLDLSNNLIGILVNHFSNGLKKVEWLSLRNNIINEIYPNVIGVASNLRHLDLSYNKLRVLKEGTFDGQLNNLSTVLLNDNKLTSIQPKEFERLKNIYSLDLSSNRLDVFYQEVTKWMRSRGVMLDLRQNNLVCTCELLPFISWVDTLIWRNQTRHLSSNNAGRSPKNDMMLTMLMPINRQSRNHNYDPSAFSQQISQYLHLAELVSNINCTKPEILSGKSVMQIIELANSSEMNCDRMYLEDMLMMKRLKSPIHFSGAEYYHHNGNQNLKIGWNLMDYQLDLVNFVIIKTKFLKSFDLKGHQLSRASRNSMDLNPNNNQDSLNQRYEISEQTVERIPYDQRTSILRDLDPSSYYVICISYETIAASNEDFSPTSKMIDSNSPLLTTTSFNDINNTYKYSSTSEAFEALLADTLRVNCADLDTLLHHDEVKEQQLVSRAPYQLGTLNSLIPAAYLTCAMQVVLMFLLF